MKNLYYKILLPFLFLLAIHISLPAYSQSEACVVNKVRLIHRGDCCLDRLKGATIQASNDRITWTTLYTINVNATGTWQEFSFPNTTAYAYVRYKASATSYGELYEIEFYNNTTKLTGKTFGTSGKLAIREKYTAAFDGSTSTMWAGSALGTSNYVGLQLNTCSNIAPYNTFSVDEVRIKFRDCCFDRLIGAKVQGSLDNLTWTDLYVFTKAAIGGTWEEFLIPNKNNIEYKYLRFVSGPTGYGELAGLEFYSKLNLLTGTGFGSSGTSNSSTVYSKALDDDDLTSWHGSAVGTSNFVGIQLNIPTRGIGSAQSTTNTTSGSTFSTTDKNFIITRAFKQKTTDAYTGNTQVASINVVYLDGFGRPIQSTGVQMNPTGKDILRHVEYDNMERSPVQYLPFVNLTEKANGAFLNDAKNVQKNYYNSTNPDGNITKDDKPWAETKFETNPFGRSTEIRGAGKNYENFPTLVDYKFNKKGDINVNDKTGVIDEGDVLRYTYVGNYDPTDISNLTKIKLEGKYGANTINVVEVTQKDKNDAGEDIYRKVKQYRDFEGRNILTRTWDNDISAWLETYYIYDDLNQIRAVFSPKLSELYNGSTITFPIDFSAGAHLTRMNELAHLYMYDELGRLIVKKETGIENKQFIYDNYDRLIFSQDANQRTRGVWSYVHYDVLNRVSITGEAVLSATENASYSAGLRKRTAYQNAISTATSGYSRYTSRTGNNYTSINTTVNGLTATYTPLSYTYYDDYSFTLPTGASLPAGALTTPRGFATGTSVKVLGEETWLKEVTYYDNDYHDIKTYKDIYGLPAATAGSFAVEIATNNFNPLFHGQIISQVTEHTNLANSATPIITKKFCYDHEERLKTITYKVADGSNDKQAKEVIGATYLYNDLGQAILKGMHQTSTMKDPAIYVGFKYHLQGMLTEVKSSLFAQQIYYDVRKDGTKGYFNGNSSELFHRFDEKQDGDLRGQKFKYDYVNRYVENKNVSTSGAGYKTWNNLEKINYDPNGNINGLIRQKDGIGIIDNLIYNYRNSGNILEKVFDNGNSNLGFVPRGTNTYSFDVNGNLLTDANKGINTAITYNYLDLPTQIVVPDASGTNKTLNYTYDASGRKLAMLVSNTTDKVLYTGEIEYNNQSLPTRIHTPMGYVSRDANGLWQYSYNLKDFQGNVRVTAKYDPNTALSITTQKTDYFVMGLPIRYDSDNFNRYLYQDKEQQPYSEFFDFGWRQYDPLVGRWFNNDPADEFEDVSPYSYVLGNPLRYSDPSGASVFTQFWNFMKYGPKPGSKLIGPTMGHFHLVKGAFSGAQLASAVFTSSRIDALAVRTTPRINTPCGTPDCREERISNAQNEYSKIAKDQVKALTLEDDIKELDPYASFNLNARKNAQTIVDIAEGGALIKGIGSKAIKEALKLAAKNGGKIAVREGRKLWILTKEGASVIKNHKTFGTIYKSKSDGLWWAVDKAGHGGSKFKVFKETNKGLEWFKDADEFGDFIINKHKGPTGTSIPWSQLSTLK